MQNQLQTEILSLFHHLQKLELFCCFPLDFTDFSFYQHIPVVALRHKQNGKLPSLPPFYGERIRLEQFCLSSWSKQPLVTIRECSFRYCVGLETFPEMPQLEELNVSSCSDVGNVSSVMNYLRVLSVESCDELSTLSISCCLRDFRLCFCNKIREIPRIGHAQKIRISFCDQLEKIGSFQNVVRATIAHCSKLSVIENISSSPSKYFKAVQYIYPNYQTQITSPPTMSDSVIYLPWNIFRFKMCVV
jgi:hypothetical protein